MQAGAELISTCVQITCMHTLSIVKTNTMKCTSSHNVPPLPVQGLTEKTIREAMGKRQQQGAPHTFRADANQKPPTAEQPGTHIMVVSEEVRNATSEVLHKPKVSKHAHAIPLGMAFEWAMKGEKGASRATSRREAILAIMEALASDSDFWQYAEGPVQYGSIKAMWEAAVGELQVHFTPRLKQLLH